MIKNYYKFVIPVKPDSINQVCEYGKKSGDVIQMKHKWEKIARVYVRREINDYKFPVKFAGKIGVHFKLFFELERERDGDNYTLMCKGILDAFMKEGLIEDDNYKYVDDNGRRFGIDKDGARVEVHITEKVDDDKIISINYEQEGHKNRHKSIIGSYKNFRFGESPYGLASKDGKSGNASKSSKTTSKSDNG